MGLSISFLNGSPSGSQGYTLVQRGFTFNRGAFMQDGVAVITKPLLPADEESHELKVFDPNAELRNEIYKRLDTDALILNSTPGIILNNRFQRFEPNIAEGAMGLVYLAKDLTKNNKLVVVKILKAQHDPIRFQREIRIQQALSGDKSIVTVYGHGETNGEIYIAMELLKGGTVGDLIKLLRQGSLKDEQKELLYFDVLDMICQTAETLDRAHRKDAIHRDIKPSNLLVHLNGEELTYPPKVKIGDFGLARRLGTDDSTLTRSGTFVGTPAFAAPEQFGERADRRSDLYALGVIIYQLITGDLPFKGEPLAVMNEKISKTPPDAIKHPDAYLPKDECHFLGYIASKLMRPDPDERYRTGSELIADLNQVIHPMLLRDRPRRTGNNIIKIKGAHNIFL